MTSLIDVIFLLLLFFMLSSTFTRFAEVDLAATGAGSGASPEKPVFISLSAEGVTLNGQTSSLPALPADLNDLRPADRTLSVLVSSRADVSSQRLTDLLVVLRNLSDLDVTVLGGS